MATRPDPTTLLARRDALATELRRLPTVEVALPWPAQGFDGILGRLWATLAPDDALGPWRTTGQGPRTSDVAALTAEGLGHSSTSSDYGAVRGDATITQDWLVHRDWMITTHEISDCTMSTLTFQIWAPADRLEALAAVVRRVASEAAASPPPT